MHAGPLQPVWSDLGPADFPSQINGMTGDEIVPRCYLDPKQTVGASNYARLDSGAGS